MDLDILSATKLKKLAIPSEFVEVDPSRPALPIVGKP
jgi:hypothetical protein